MPRLYFAVPGPLEQRTGGTIYDRRVAEALREDGWWVEMLAWPATFPFPNEDDRLAVSASLAALPDNALVMIDGLALGTLPGLARREKDRLRLVALVHHPLALETGLSPMMAATFASEEQDALASVRAVIVTSDTTAAIVEAAFGVPGERITVAHPGVDRPRTLGEGAPRAERRPGPVRIFTMGSISPRKSHHILIEALARIEDLDWTCVIAGSLEREPEVAEALIGQIAMLGLGERVTLAGEIDAEQAERLYADADIFALASVYEGYGMVFAEAQAHGLPIVATTGGSIQEVVGEDAGLLVPPNDAPAFAEALRALVTDPEMRAALAAGSAAAGAALPGWNHTAALIAKALDDL
ncbi:MAG: glycosyltransferase family 4 protein [Caulobacteraceae bacterium]